MNWREIIMDSIVVAIIGVIAALITNVFVDRRGYDKVNRKIGALTNTTLSGQHENIEKTIIGQANGVKENIANIRTNELGHICTKVDQINRIMNKNEGRYENLNLDQQKIKDNVGKLVSDWEKLVIENRELKERNTELEKKYMELDKQYKKLLSKNRKARDRDKGMDR